MEHQYSWADKWPTLTELFFGEGNGPQGPLNAKDTNQDAQDEILVSTGKTEDSHYTPGPGPLDGAK
jgi:hypothetical protein|tara:strand:+ start:729 stop:926 length:198 start_codon:yes stop_codon:yes gene_type:complete